MNNFDKKKARTKKRTANFVGLNNPQSKHVKQVERQRIRKKTAKKNDTSNQCYYNEKELHDINDNYIPFKEFDTSKVTGDPVYDDLDTYYGLNPFKRTNKCEIPLPSSSYPANFITINVDRADRYLDYCQLKHHEHRPDCDLPRIRIEYEQIGNAAGYNFHGTCMTCGYSATKFSVDKFININGGKYNVSYLSRIEGSRQLSIGFDETLMHDGVYTDTNLIRKPTWTRYNEVLIDIAQHHAMKSMDNAKKRLKRGPLNIGFDASYTNAPKSRSSPNAFAYFIEQSYYKIIHMEVASKGLDGNFEGYSGNMEPEMLANGLRKLHNLGHQIEVVSFDGDNLGHVHNDVDYCFFFYATQNYNHHGLHYYLDPFNEALTIADEHIIYRKDDVYNDSIQNEIQSKMND
eukprot:229919_1